MHTQKQGTFFPFQISTQESLSLFPPSPPSSFVIAHLCLLYFSFNSILYDIIYFF